MAASMSAARDVATQRIKGCSRSGAKRFVREPSRRQLAQGYLPNRKAKHRSATIRRRWPTSPPNSA